MDQLPRVVHEKSAIHSRLVDDEDIIVGTGICNVAIGARSSLEYQIVDHSDSPFDRDEMKLRLLRMLGHCGRVPSNC